MNTYLPCLQPGIGTRWSSCGLWRAATGCGLRRQHACFFSSLPVFLRSPAYRAPHVCPSHPPTSIHGCAPPLSTLPPPSSPPPAPRPPARPPARSCANRAVADGDGAVPRAAIVAGGGADSVGLRARRRPAPAQGLPVGLDLPRVGQVKA